jgi:AmmeMemoRadiSam system protein B
LTDGEPPFVRAVIVPHAGYVYSGETAVRTLLPAVSHKRRRILVIAPSHRVPFRGIALCTHSHYRTPLGDVPVDRETVARLAGLGVSAINVLDNAHAGEHALEVELPILQELFGEFHLVPLICGHLDAGIAMDLAASLMPLWEPDTLWVVSSDFTHYGRSFGYLPFSNQVKENLKTLDLGAADQILALDPNGFVRYVETTGATICGAAPIQLLLNVVRLANEGLKKRPIRAELADYTTSGEATGDYSHCVSYVGFRFSE